MSSTSYESVPTSPPALGVSKTSSAGVAKVLYGAGEASRSGIWVGIFAIIMSFAAFTSALFVRQGSSADWAHIALPAILYGNTLALLLSSATLQMARRAILAVAARESLTNGMGLSRRYGKDRATRHLQSGAAQQKRQRISIKNRRPGDVRPILRGSLAHKERASQSRKRHADRKDAHPDSTSRSFSCSVEHFGHSGRRSL